MMRRSCGSAALEDDFEESGDGVDETDAAADEADGEGETGGAGVAALLQLGANGSTNHSEALRSEQPSLEAERDDANIELEHELGDEHGR
jgi:hypothetical protein